MRAKYPFQYLYAYIRPISFLHPLHLDICILIVPFLMMQHITTDQLSLNITCMVPLDQFPKRRATSRAKIVRYTLHKGMDLVSNAPSYRHCQVKMFFMCVELLYSKNSSSTKKRTVTLTLIGWWDIPCFQTSVRRSCLCFTKEWGRVQLSVLGITYQRCMWVTN